MCMCALCAPCASPSGIVCKCSAQAMQHRFGAQGSQYSAPGCFLQAWGFAQGARLLGVRNGA
eukprot:8145849-Lingulodinium_polyedra.AAC.1